MGGLDELWDTQSILTYATENGKKLRENQHSCQENAAFLVMWGSELFGEWATWMT